MSNEFLIVEKGILPDYFEKVIEARKLLQSGEANEVTEAVKMVGISRSTYYKYKDAVFLSSNQGEGRRAVISFWLLHEPGVLGRVLNLLSDRNANVFTISQNPPVNNRALVVISIVIDHISCGINDVLADLEKLTGVEKCTLLDID